MKHNLMTGITARIASFLIIAPLLSLGLAGCGSTGGGQSLTNSASLAPTGVRASKKAKPGPAPKVAGVKKTPGPIAEKGKAPQTAAIKKKPAPAARPAPIVTAKAVTPPTPVHKPYVKTRAKKIVAKAKPKPRAAVKKTAKLAPGKRQLIQTGAQKTMPAVTASLAKPPKPKTLKKTPKKVMAKKAAPKPAPAKMVPAQAISMQAVPQDIADAFNEPATPKPAPEKLAEAKPLPIEHNFGKSEHRFSGQ